MRRITILCIASAGLLLTTPVSAATVSADLDKSQAAVKEEIGLTIRIEGAQGNIQAPRLPAVDGLDIFYTGRTSHLSIVNGASSSKLEFNYVLVPQKPGKIVIRPFDIVVSGQNFRTGPIEIEVAPSLAHAANSAAPVSALPPPATFVPSAQQASNPPLASSPNASSDDDNIYVIAAADKITAYPNEQVLLNYSLYTRYDTRYEGFKEEPEVPGFWVEEIPMGQSLAKETVQVNGKRYIRAELKKIALFATAPAEYTIKPGVIQVSIRKEPRSSSVFDEFFDDSFFSGGSFFARREDLLLRPPAIQLQIIPFPENGKPKSFQGAVGQFRIEDEIDKTTVNQDEPVTLKITLEGEGNIETLRKPLIPDLPGFRTYDADTNHQLYKRGDRIGGKKTFEIVFIPTQPGTAVIPALEFSYFNPVSNNYVLLKTREYPLTVLKSQTLFTMPNQLAQDAQFKKDIQLQEKDIRYIQEKLTSAQRYASMEIANRILALLNLALTIGLIGWFFRSVHVDRMNKNLSLKRKVHARMRAEKSIKKLPALVRSHEDGRAPAFYEEVEKIITQYFADKFNLSTLGMTKSALSEKLELTLGADHHLLHDIMSLYDRCEAARFAKAETSNEDKNEALQILKDAIRQFEKIRI